MFLFNYFKLSIWSIIYYYKPNELLLKIVHKNIKDSGCIAVKFVQWILPRIEVIYKIDKKTKENQWFYEFEELYENCNYHSLGYTEKIYKKDFNKTIDEDYIIDELLASGSIGQAYKIHNKKGESFVLKIIHPDMNQQIYFLSILIKILYIIPITKNYLEYKLPISLTDFITDFKSQTNLVHEGNNCLRFNKEYSNNPYIIIPEVYQLSENILIMSYEEGESIDTIDVSDYIKYQSALIMKMFIKHNQYFFNYMHGDLHKGNLKMRKDGKVVIYDFGFCWGFPSYLKESFQIIDKACINLKTENIDSFIDAFHLVINKKVSKKVVSEEIIKVFESSDLRDPSLLLEIITNLMKDNNIVVESYVIQAFILHTQMHKNLTKFNITITEAENKDIAYEYYHKQIQDIICFCETKNIFNEYKNFLEEEFEKENIQIKEVFGTVRFDNIPNLKELAIS